MDPVMQKIDEAILLIVLRRQRRMRQEEERSSRRRFWVHPMVSNRFSTGYFGNIYSQLRSYPTKFFNFTRMSVPLFDDLLERLRPRLTRMDTVMRSSVSPEERMLVTLRFLATGQSYASLHHYFLLGLSTVSKIIKETCVAIWEELHNVVMPEPTEDIWESVVDTFWEKTQFPNCIGALDGKHIRVKKPPHSGSSYFNYKKYFSVVLLALSDAHLKFLFVDVGAYGSQGDARIFRESAFGRRLHEGRLNIPESRPLPCTEEPSLPLVMVADEAFGLAENLMRPYSGTGLSRQQKIFNYRLSRARHVVECAFGGVIEVVTSCPAILSIIPHGTDSPGFPGCLGGPALKEAAGLQAAELEVTVVEAAMVPAEDFSGPVDRGRERHLFIQASPSSSPAHCFRCQKRFFMSATEPRCDLLYYSSVL
ncbi:uncharacterized protein [Aquarana catesbeiana]|uniref:uncharacterized protein n=1 Tax=Aquarana catesbeiana TaxID=8400 RepID=UPI003CC97AD9